MHEILCTMDIVCTQAYKSTTTYLESLPIKSNMIDGRNEYSRLNKIQFVK